MSYQSRLLLCLLLAVFISGCGGSGSQSELPSASEDSDNIAATNNGNSLPEIRGLLSNRVLAEERTEFVFEIRDADDDDITLELTSPPEWLTYSATNDALMVTVNPDFFDIGNYRIDMRLSDGKDNRDYVLEFAVDDNPARYSSIRIVSSNLVGIHRFQSRDVIHLFESGKGLFIDVFGNHFQVRWSVNRFGQAHINLYDVNCFSCGRVREYTLRIVAQQGSEQRWVLTPSDEDLETFASNTVALETPELVDGAYIGFGQFADVLGRVDTENKRIILPTTVAVGSANIEVVFDVPLNNDNDVVLPEAEALFPLHEHFSKLFFNQDAGTFLDVYFDLYPDDLVVEYMDANVMQVRFSVLPRLHASNQNMDLAAYDKSLTDYLNTPMETVALFAPLTPANAEFLFTAESTYYSRFEAVTEVVINGQTVPVSGATELSLTSDLQAQLVVHAAGRPDFVEVQNVQWQATENFLFLGGENSDQLYELYENKQGELLLAGYPLVGEYAGVYPLIVSSESDMNNSEPLPSVAELKGGYVYATDQDYFSVQEHFFFTEDDRMEFRTTNSVSVWEDRLKVQPDEAMEVILGDGQCRSFSKNYESCLSLHESVFNNRGHEYELKRIKLVKVEEDKYYFATQEAVMSSRPFGESYVESGIQVMKRIEQ